MTIIETVCVVFFPSVPCSYIDKQCLHGFAELLRTAVVIKIGNLVWNFCMVSGSKNDKTFSRWMFIIEPSEILAWNGKLLFTDVNYAVILDLTNSSYNFPCKNWGTISTKKLMSDKIIWEKIKFLNYICLGAEHHNALNE